MNYQVNIVEDSIAPNGTRLTTFQLKYPRMVHCFDDQTEILVKKKNCNSFPEFKKFSAVVFNEDYLVAQVEPDSLEMEFVEPKTWIENDFDGDMVSIEYQRLSMLVTPEHRLLVDSRKGNGLWKRETILAKDLLGKHTTKKINKAGSLKTTSRLGVDPNLAKLVAYFVSDGHTPKAGHKSNFHFRKQRKIDEVQRLLTACQIPFTVSLNDPATNDTTIRFRTQDWMKLCYNNSKKILPPFLWNMDTAAFEEFKQGLLESDGCVNNHEFNTYSSEMIENLQVLFHLNNSSFNMRSYGELYKVKFLKEETPTIRRDKTSAASVQPYKGKVYCVSVPSSYLMVRRNGIVHISGNCELLTHRVFSRNASSSRAIPVNKIIQQVIDDPAMPVYWGKNQSGMQAREELLEPTKQEAIKLWLEGRDKAVETARQMVALGVHKQIANRVLEPWHHIHVVLTATEFDNWFELRSHKDAQPEIKMLSDMMLKEYNLMRVSKTLQKGEWHLPFLTPTEKGNLPLSSALKISTARCARVSYMNHDGTNTELSKDFALHDALVVSNPKHMSPSEHQAVLMDGSTWYGNFRGFKQYRKFIEEGFVL